MKSSKQKTLLWILVQATLLSVTKAGNATVAWKDVPSYFLNGWMEFWFLHTLLMIFTLDLLARALGATNTARLMLGILLLAGASFVSAWSYPWRNLTDYYIYFALGGIMAGFQLQFTRSQIWALFCGGPSFLLFFHYHGCEFGQPLFFVSALSGIIACLSFCMLLPGSAWLAPLRLMGRYSLQGFCLHVIFAAGIRAILLHFSYTNFVGHCIIGIIVGLTFPVIAGIIDEKYLGFLFRLPKGLSKSESPKSASSPVQQVGTQTSSMLSSRQ